MTRAEYEAKYGVAPSVPPVSATPAPVKMTRAEYESKYGVTPEGQKTKTKGVLPQLVSDIVDSAKTRTGKIKSDFEQRETFSGDQKGKLTSPEVGYRTAGNIAGFAGDVIFNVAKAGVKAVTPDVIEKAVVEKGKKIVSSEPAQKIIGGIAKTYEKIPERVRESAIEPTLNIASIIPAGKGAQVAQKATKKATKIIAEKSPTIASKTIDVISDKTTKMLEKNYVKKLNLREGQNRIQAQSGQSVERFLAERPSLKVNQAGKNFDTEKVVGKIIKEVEPKQKQMRDLVKAQGKIVNLDDYAGNAKKLANERYSKSPVVRQSIIKEIDSHVAELRKAYPDGKIPLEDVVDIKSENWNLSRFDMARTNDYRDAQRLLGKSGQEIVEKNVDNVDVKAMNKELGSYYNAIDRLEFLNGKKIPGGRLGGFFNKTIGAIAGASGAGFIGSIIGVTTADALATILSGAKQSTLRRAQKILKARGKESLFDDAIKKISTAQASRMLPAPKSGTPTVSNMIPILLPEKTTSTLESLQKTNKAIKVPKTTQSTIKSQTRYAEQIKRANEAVKQASQASKPLPVIDFGKPAPKTSKVPTVSSESSPNVIVPERVTRYASKTPVTGGTFQNIEKNIKMPVLYHGTTEKNAKSILKSGWDVSKNTKGQAESPYALFASKSTLSTSDHSAGSYGSSILKITPKKNSKIKTLDSNGWYETLGKSKNAQETKNIVSNLKKQGYDVVIDPSGEYIILNPSKFEFSKAKKGVINNRYTK